MTGLVRYLPFPGCIAGVAVFHSWHWDICASVLHLKQECVVQLRLRLKRNTRTSSEEETTQVFVRQRYQIPIKYVHIYTSSSITVHSTSNPPSHSLIANKQLPVFLLFITKNPRFLQLFNKKLTWNITTLAAVANESRPTNPFPPGATTYDFTTRDTNIPWHNEKDGDRNSQLVPRGPGPTMEVNEVSERT